MQEILRLSGVAQRQRRHSSFMLDTLVVIKVNVSVNEIIRFLECPRFVPLDTFCLQDREEIFRHRIVIGISFP